MTELPRRIKERVDHERWTAEALDRAADPFGEPEAEPEAETPQAAFMRRMAEQREAEDKHEARVSRALHEDPNARPDAPPDPLQTLFARQQAARRRVRSRSTRRSTR